MRRILPRGFYTDKTVPCRTTERSRAHVQLICGALAVRMASEVCALASSWASRAPPRVDVVACEYVGLRLTDDHHELVPMMSRPSAMRISDSLIRILTEESHRGGRAESDLSSRSRCSRVACLILAYLQ